MGFSIERFFEEMKELLARDMKPKQKQREIEALVYRAEKYAKECGQIR